MGIVGTIVAVAKAFPAIESIVSQANAALVQISMARTNREFGELEDKVDEISHLIRNAKTKKQRRIYARMLADYTTDLDL